VDDADNSSTEEEELDAEVRDNELLKGLELEEVEELFRVPLPVTDYKDGTRGSKTSKKRGKNRNLIV